MKNRKGWSALNTFGGGGRCRLGAFLVHLDERLLNHAPDEYAGLPGHPGEIGISRERLKHAHVAQDLGQREP